MTKQQDTAETSQQAGVPAGRITNHMANQDQGGGTRITKAPGDGASGRSKRASGSSAARGWDLLTHLVKSRKITLLFTPGFSRGWDCARGISPLLHFPRTPSNY